MNRLLWLEPEAEQELADAFLWYDEQVEGLGAEFLLAVDACLQSILRFPLGYPKVRKTIRRALLRRFPYAIFYVLKPGQISVLAVFHVKRDPTHWLRRAQSSP